MEGSIQIQSNYFLSSVGGNKSVRGQQQSQTKQVVSFPTTKSVLWDRQPVGNKMVLHLSHNQSICLHVLEKCLWLAYRHATQANRQLYSGFFIGSINLRPDEEGIEITLDRFDPGREMPGGKVKMPSAKLPGDLIVPVCFSSDDGSIGTTHGLNDFTNAMEFLDHTCSSRETVDVNNMVTLRLQCQVYEGEDDVTFSLHIGAVTLKTAFETVLIKALPVIPTALARNLSGPLNLSGVQKTHKLGFITMDQTRKLLLLLHTDPKAYTMPLVGIWVSGINHIQNPVVWATCLKFMFSSSIQERVLTSDGAFLVVLYSPSHKQPLFHECHLAGNSPDLYFDLIGCKEQLHVYKHGNGSGSPPVQMELRPARDGPSKALFMQAFQQFYISRVKSSTSQSALSKSSHTNGTDDGVYPLPRPSPKPHMTKSPTVRPSVPELSIIFDENDHQNSGNTPSRESHFISHSTGKVYERGSQPQHRPGPLKPLNIQQRQPCTNPRQQTQVPFDKENIPHSPQNGQYRRSDAKGQMRSRMKAGTQDPTGAPTNGGGVPGKIPYHSPQNENSHFPSLVSYQKDVCQDELLSKKMTIQEVGNMYSPEDKSGTPRNETGYQSASRISHSHWYSSSRRGSIAHDIGHLRPPTHQVPKRFSEGYAQRTHPMSYENDVQAIPTMHQERNNAVNTLPQEIMKTVPMMQQSVFSQSIEQEGRSNHNDNEDRFPPRKGAYTDASPQILHSLSGGRDGTHTLQISQTGILTPSDGMIHDNNIHPSPCHPKALNFADISNPDEVIQNSTTDPQSSVQDVTKDGASEGQLSPATMSHHQCHCCGSQNGTPSSATKNEGLHMSTGTKKADVQQKNDTLELLKKQEKMIEALQNQIKYLLQMQSANVTSPLFTPPVMPQIPSAPQSGSVHRAYAPTGMHTYNQSSPHPSPPQTENTAGQNKSKEPHQNEKRHSRGIEHGHMTHSQNSDAPNSIKADSEHNESGLSSPNHHQAGYHSTNQLQKGQHSPDQHQVDIDYQRLNRSPSYNEGQHQTTNSNSNQSHTSHNDASQQKTNQYPLKQHHYDNYRESSNTSQPEGQRSAESSADDWQQSRTTSTSSFLSRDPRLEVDLETTGDDTHSLDKVELKSFPGSGSVTSSPHSSPTRGSHYTHSPQRDPPRISPSQSPPNRERSSPTHLSTPPMPSFRSPVLGESASTIMPPNKYQHYNTEMSVSDEDEDVFREDSVNHEGVVMPSLLLKDEKQFYQNLLIQVDQMLLEKKADEKLTLQEAHPAGGSQEEANNLMSHQVQSDVLVELHQSILFRSYYGTIPELHPRINYTSLADMTLSPSDLSMEADAIAMKYLSNEELATLSSEIKSAKAHGKGVNALLRTALTGVRLGGNMWNDKSFSRTPLELSLASKKYMEKYGLADAPVEQAPSRQSEAARHEMEKGSENEVQSSQQQLYPLPLKQFCDQHSTQNQFLPSRNILEKDSDENILPPLNREPCNNILDLNKLKKLPKLL